MARNDELLKKLDVDTVFLTYLARVTKIPLDTLVFLYDEFGNKLFFLFFLLSGNKILFPSAITFKLLQKKARASMQRVNDNDFTPTPVGGSPDLFLVDYTPSLHVDEQGITYLKVPMLGVEVVNYECD